MILMCLREIKSMITLWAFKITRIFWHWFWNESKMWGLFEDDCQDFLIKLRNILIAILQIKFFVKNNKKMFEK